MQQIVYRLVTKYSVYRFLITGLQFFLKYFQKVYSDNFHYGKMDGITTTSHHVTYSDVFVLLLQLDGYSFPSSSLTAIAYTWRKENT